MATANSSAGNRQKTAREETRFEDVHRRSAKSGPCLIRATKIEKNAQKSCTFAAEGKDKPAVRELFQKQPPREAKSGEIWTCFFSGDGLTKYFFHGVSDDELI